MPKKEPNLPIIGGVIAAFGAGLCCAGPIIFIMLGLSGSWVSNLSMLEPFRPIFILLVLILFSYAGWIVYRPIDECEPRANCAVPQVRTRRQVTFWLTALLALGLVTSSYWVAWFF